MMHVAIMCANHGKKVYMYKGWIHCYFCKDRIQPFVIPAQPKPKKKKS